MRFALELPAVIGAVLWSGAAFAQAAQGTQPPATPQATPGSPQTIPEKTPAAPGTDGSARNLTEKLGETGGVIKPPGDVDPAMAKPAPSTQPSMPVIKPPEEKGGPTAK